MRLLAYTDARSVGGAEIVLGYLIGALGPDYEVGVLAVERAVGEAVAARRPGTVVATVREPAGLRDRGALAEHRRAIRAFAPAVVHVNQAWPWAGGYAIAAAVASPGVRAVAVDHLPVGGAIPRVRRAGRRLLARRLDAHVAVGERAAREVERLVGLPDGSVLAVPNGVPAELPQPAPPLAPGTVVGSLGRLTDQKDYAALVRVLPRLEGVTLALVGDGPQRPALERLAAELGVADRMLITGWVEDARRHLPALDVFALPSRWEGMPLVILEAMHAGVPVVATDVGSVAEAVADGETGYVVAPGDGDALAERLGRLVADGELRRRLGERARAVAAERFSATAMAARYDRVYRAVAAGDDPAAALAR
ncbi:MAG: glycosyltransferase family 4 protein [Solirubrobacterales bacterium]|nr:glycosyltransferase family 4 protein [Solirubrobacterales bacterium]